jgi:hypothetical protein
MLKCIARHVTDDSIMVRIRDSISVPDGKGRNTDTIIMFNTLCLSAATMFT